MVYDLNDLRLTKLEQTRQSYETSAVKAISYFRNDNVTIPCTAVAMISSKLN